MEGRGRGISWGSGLNSKRVNANEGPKGQFALGSQRSKPVPVNNAPTSAPEERTARLSANNTQPEKPPSNSVQQPLSTDATTAVPLENASQEIANSSSEKFDSSAALSSLQEQLAALSSVATNHQKREEQIQQILAELQQMGQMSAELDRKKMELAEVNKAHDAQLHTISLERELAEKQLHDQLQHVQTLATQLQEAQQTIKEISSQKAELTETVSHLKKQLEQHELEASAVNTSLVEQRIQWEAQVRAQQATISQLEAAVSDATAQSNELRRQLDAAELKLASKDKELAAALAAKDAETTKAITRLEEAHALELHNAAAHNAEATATVQQELTIMRDQLAAVTADMTKQLSEKQAEITVLRGSSDDTKNHLTELLSQKDAVLTQTRRDLEAAVERARSSKKYSGMIDPQQVKYPVTEDYRLQSDVEEGASPTTMKQTRSSWWPCCGLQ